MRTRSYRIPDDTQPRCSMCHVIKPVEAYKVKKLSDSGTVRYKACEPCRIKNLGRRNRAKQNAPQKPNFKDFLADADPAYKALVTSRWGLD